MGISNDPIKRAKQYANLEKGMFKKGQNGTPNPTKGERFSTTVKKVLEKLIERQDPLEGDMKKLSVQEQIVLRWAALALQGDMMAISTIRDAAEEAREGETEQDAAARRQATMEKLRRIKKTEDVCRRKSRR